MIVRTFHGASHACAPRRAGSTLLELIVALAILSLVVGVAGLSMRAGRDIASADSTATRVAAARTAAIRGQHPITIVVMTSSRPRNVTALPDGGVIADSALGVDRTTGRRAHATR